MRKIINRYIFKEISWLFFIIFFVLTFVFVMGNILQIMDLYVNKGISFFSIAKAVFFLLPHLSLFTIPGSLLIAILVAIGRFSADNEITAFRTSGVSLLQIYYPVALASLIAFLFTSISVFFLMPQSYSASKRLFFEIAAQNASVGIKEKVFTDNFKDLVLYADRISSDNHYMEGVLVSDNRIMDQPNTILAERAFLISNPDLMLVKISLREGSVHTISDNYKNYRRIDFERYDINLDLSTIIKQGRHDRKTKDEMTVKELLKMAEDTSITEKEHRTLIIEAHKRFAVPLSCIIFGFLALPLGIRSHRAVKSRGFTIGIILASSYYLLRLAGEALSETGYIAPVIGIWAPNIIFSSLGIFLFFLSYREYSVVPKIMNKIRLSIFK